MIDIHSHVMFGVDDGAQEIEQSLKMLKMASQAGITAICLTPHYMEDGYRTEKEKLRERFQFLKQEMEKLHIPLHLCLGEEVFLFPTLADHLEEIVCLNDSRYLLVEIPLVEELYFVEEVFYRLFSMGKVPILAHPERYLVVARNFSYLEELVQKGVLVQMNLHSLIGHYGKGSQKLAMKLLKSNMVHLVGTDAHSVAGYEAVTQSVKSLKKVVSEEMAQKLLEINPRKILQNEVIEENEK